MILSERGGVGWIETGEFVLKAALAAAKISLDVFNTMSAADLGNEAMRLRRDELDLQRAVAFEQLAQAKADLEAQRSSPLAPFGGWIGAAALLVAAGAFLWLGTRR